MNFAELVSNKGKAWDWAMDWVEYSKTGSHAGVKAIRELADQVKDKFYFDGLWNPDGHIIYDLLREAQDMAQDEYEKAQPALET